MGKCMHFNRESIERISMPTDRDRSEYRDSKEPGLYLYSSRGGAKTFYLYRKFRGKPLRIKIGRYPDFSVTAARERARELKGMLAKGEMPQTTPTTNKPEQVTLGEIGREYLRVRNLSKGSVKLYQGRLDTQLKPWSGRPIASISKKQLVALHGDIARKSGKHMADLTMKLFGAIYNFFMDRHDHPGPNPVKTLSANKLWKTSAADRRQGIIARNDLPKWFRVVMRHESKDERDYLFLLLMTGMRRTEAVTMRWEHVDFEKKMFTVHETKNGKSHSLPMTGFLEELFQSRFRGKRNQTGLVFPSQRDRNAPMYVSTLSERIGKEAGISFTLHDLRRTFITMADELDLSEYVVKRLVNHSTASDVTAGYIISEVDRLREPLEKITQYILSLAGEQNE